MNALRTLPILLALPLPAQESAAPAASLAWLTDFDRAKAVAAETGKDLLLDFTGSDWCGWCVKLREEVFDAEAFAAQAPSHFVFVELDFPRRKQLDAATKAQNERLQGELGVQGYPTIFLADAEGRPYARTGYRPGGPDKYLAHLDELRAVKAQRDEAWVKASQARHPAERAQRLAEGLEALAPELHAQYASVMEEIVQASGEGELAATWRPRLAEARLLPKVGALRRSFADLAKQEKWTDAGQAVATFLAENDVQGDLAGELHYLRGMAAFRGDDHAGALEAFRRCRTASPKLGEQIDPIIEQLEAEAKEHAAPRQGDKDG